MSFPTTHLRSVVTPDGAVILDGEHDLMYALNATGGYIWRALQEGSPIEEIIQRLANETGADPTLVSNDVQAFLSQLAQRHLLAS